MPCGVDAVRYVGGHTSPDSPLLARLPHDVTASRNFFPHSAVVSQAQCDGRTILMIPSSVSVSC
jgi:hypothetical protein